jgi:hypothetical protein
MTSVISKLSHRLRYPYLTLPQAGYVQRRPGSVYASSTQIRISPSSVQAEILNLLAELQRESSCAG